MPFKRKAKRGGKRKAKRGRRRKGFYRSAVGKGEVMINRTKSRLHNVVAPHYLTKLEYGFTGSQVLAAGVQGYFNIWLNGLYNPGDKPVQPGGGGPNVPNFVDFSDAGFGGTVYPATLALNALSPVGLAQLSTLYEKYRVFASKIQVTCTPSENTSALEPASSLAVLPINGVTLANGDNPMTMQEAQSSPYAKCIMCTANNNVKMNTIQMYMDAPTLIGYTKAQYKDDPFTSAAITSNPYAGNASLGVPNYPGVYWQINTSPFSSTAVPVNLFEVRVTYWVEFFEPIAPTDIDPSIPT